MIASVLVDPRARRAWPVLAGLTAASPGTVLVGSGEVVRVREDGTAEEILPGGHPRGGAASDPCNTRSAA